MSYKDEWTGSKDELEELSKEIIDTLWINEGFDLSEVDMRKLFCDALAHSNVVDELRRTAVAIYKKSSV